ncbi:ELMO domain-containing protein 3 [Chelonia mydas]|uniref:ELMO domain-containing protein 3 n=1 Tax=Chelonia mydas TaxID=8469 RepID=M7AT70_CHEMY|nr:ELMO domain-containing protein 3 [Chelonia mydas]
MGEERGRSKLSKLLPCSFTSLSQISVLKQNGLLQALAEGANGRTEADPSAEVLRAQEEWEAVENLQSGIVGTSAGPVPLIAFNEALQYFQTADLSECRKKIQPTVQRRGLSAVAHFFFGPPRLHQQLQGERDLALAIAQCGLDNNEKVHMRILQTIYKKLTGSRFDCPRYGAHWEELGFQAKKRRRMGDMQPAGSSYATIQDLFETPPQSSQSWHLRMGDPVLGKEPRNFPFCVMSINITRIVIQALREEHLSRECNRRQQVIAVLNDLYVATSLRLYVIWKTQQKTISDSGFVLKGCASPQTEKALCVLHDCKIQRLAASCRGKVKENFPFCVMSINITRIVIQALREEHLSRECNRRQQVIAVLNDLYVATSLRLYVIWKTQQKTISDSGFVLKDLEAFAKKKPKQLLRYLEIYMSGRAVSVIDGGFQHPSPSSGVCSPNLNSAVSNSSKEINFTGVCDPQVEMEGEARLI